MVVGFVSRSLCPAVIWLVNGSVSFRDGEAERAVQSGFLVACSSRLLEGAFVVG